MSTEQNSTHDDHTDKSELFESEQPEVPKPVVEAEADVVDGKGSERLKRFCHASRKSL